MTDLMVGDDQFLFVCQNRVLLLVSGDYDFNTLLKIRLIGKLSAVADRTERRLVDNIGKFCAGSARCHSCDLVEIHVLTVLDLLGVHFQDIFPALEVGQLYGHAAVKAAGPRQSGIQRFGTVCRGQNDHADVLLKAVHLCEQLVQCLLALIISAQRRAVSLLADRVDLVDKHNTGSFFLGLLEQVSHLGGTHADKHLHKFRSGHGEEWHVGLSGNCLGQHCLTRSGRADQQNALGHGRADLSADSLRGFDIDFGVALTHPEHH